MTKFKKQNIMTTELQILGWRINMKQLLFLFLLIINFSCTPQAPHVREGQRIRKTFTKQAYRQYGLILEGEGGEFLKDINLFYFAFASFKKIEKTNVEEAREFAVTLSEELLEMINTDNELRPYLRVYPFDSRNINIIITFCDKKNPSAFLPSKYIAAIIVNKGRILYAFFNEEIDDLADVHREPYEEAKRLFEEARGCF